MSLKYVVYYIVHLNHPTRSIKLKTGLICACACRRYKFHFSCSFVCLYFAYFGYVRRQNNKNAAMALAFASATAISTMATTATTTARTMAADFSKQNVHSVHNHKCKQNTLINAMIVNVSKSRLGLNIRVCALALSSFHSIPSAVAH